MALKKSELYSSLWSSCDELRGGMDASLYKDYVLTLLFVKYVSDRRDPLVEVPKGGSFADMVALKNHKDIGDRCNKIIAKLAEANELKGVIDIADFNDSDKLGKGKEMVDRLTKLVGIFEALDFGDNRADGDDLLGDAYEYLMRHFATESGKSKGQFYTPAEVSRIMAQVVGISGAKSTTQTVYDPTCGSGSLLLKAHDAAPVNVSIYGQEMDVATTALCRMNMILHGCPTAEIAPGGSSTLAAPHFKEKNGRLKTFDFIVANPPFSTKSWTNGFTPETDEFERFGLGVPPEKNGDYAFVLHMLASLKSSGKACIVLPHGVLFRGNAEGDIRRGMVKAGYIKGIIGLPANLFYGVGIPALLLILDKEGAPTRKGVFMVDASRGFIKDGAKNRLREQDIHRIVDTFNKQVVIEGYSRLVPTAEIESNDFNLNIPRYIDGSEGEDLHDIEGHLKGGIPERDIDALDRYWKVFRTLRGALVKPVRKGYVALAVPAGEIRSTIFGHTEFTRFQKETVGLFDAWRDRWLPKLKALKVGAKPKQLIAEMSEDLLATFRGARLVDAYDVYQRLMDLWAASMQDDVYMISAEGWKAVLDGQPNTDLIPVDLVKATYFSKELGALEESEAKRDAVTREIEEAVEEHGGDDGLLADARNDAEKINKASVTARLKVIAADRAAAEERQLLERMLKLWERESAAAKAAKDATKALEAAVAAKYGKLTADEVKSLVCEGKWMAQLAESVRSELDRVSQALTGRVRQLAERYSVPLPARSDEVASLAAKVYQHLGKMGVSWR
jgi:type I restriction enzyme M protein